MNKVKITSILLSVYFAMTLILGSSLTAYNTFEGVFSWWNLLLLPCYLILFYLIFNELITLIMKFEGKGKQFKPSFWVVFGLIMLAWSPYLLIYFPGLVQYDVGVEMSQFARRGWAWDTWHPVIHVVFLNVSYYIGRFIFGSVFGGFFFHSIIQMTILALTFSYSIKKLKEHGVTSVFLWGLLLIYMFFPQNPYMGMITIKDTLFTCFAVFFFIRTYEFIKDTSTKNLICFIVTGFLFCIGRKNGIAALYLSIPFLLVFFRERKKMAIGLAGIVVLNVLFSLSLPLFNISKGNSREALCIPMMQIYATANDLSGYQRELVGNLFGNPDRWDAFRHHFADPVKDKFQTKVFEENRSEYIKLYFQLFGKYPVQFFEVAMNLNIFYWYSASDIPASGARSTYMERQEIIPTWWLPEKVNIGRESSLMPRTLEVVDKFWDFKWAKYVPFMLPSFAIYLSLFAVTLLFLKKKKTWVFFFPLFFLWLTIIAGPVTDARYNYPFTILAPIILLYALFEREGDTA